MNLPDFTKLKLGKGIVGKTAYIAAFSIIIEAVIALTLFSLGQTWPGILFALLVPVSFVYFNERAFRYADKNPHAALLEGDNYVTVVQLQYAAKNQDMIDITPSATANTVTQQIGTSHAE